MPLSSLPASQREKLRDDAVRLRDLLRGVRGANTDARDFALFDVRDQLRGMGVPKAQIDAFDAHDDEALEGEALMDLHNNGVGVGQARAGGGLPDYNTPGIVTIKGGRQRYPSGR